MYTTWMLGSYKLKSKSGNNGTWIQRFTIRVQKEPSHEQVGYKRKIKVSKDSKPMLYVFMCFCISVPSGWYGRLPDLYMLNVVVEGQIEIANTHSMMRSCPNVVAQAVK